MRRTLTMSELFNALPIDANLAEVKGLTFELPPYFDQHIKDQPSYQNPTEMACYIRGWLDAHGELEEKESK